MKRNLGVLAVLAIVWVVGGLCWFAREGPVAPVAPLRRTVASTPLKQAGAAPPPSTSYPATAPIIRSNPPSLELAAQLNASGGDPARDVVLLHQILSQYQRALQSRQGTPIGDDIDLARALKGHNPMRLAFLPATHPALSSDGHLLDRWGTPFHLHPRGRGAFEVRSAGPDRKLFTGDDLVANPPRQEP